MTLNDLKPGEKGVISGVNHKDWPLISRIMALGLIPGEEVQVLRTAPLGDPMQVKAGSTYISVRLSDSQYIDIAPVLL